MVNYNTATAFLTICAMYKAVHTNKPFNDRLIHKEIEKEISAFNPDKLLNIWFVTKGTWLYYRLAQCILRFRNRTSLHLDLNDSHSIREHNGQDSLTHSKQNVNRRVCTFLTQTAHQEHC